MRFGKIVFAIGALWIACGGCSKRNPVAPSGSRPPVFGASDSVFTDEQLLAAAYTIYTGPAGFYSEPPTPYANPLYVNTLSVAPSGAPRDRWIELSTDDTAQARAWAVASVPWCTVAPGPPTVTRRYIEFATYEPGQGPGMPVRAHRASYLDRSGYDRFHPGPLVAVLVPRPVNTTEARGVAEYLWYKASGRNPETKVLTSYSRASEGSVLHTIFFVERVLLIGLFGPYESVRLLRNDFRVDTASGAILFRERDVRYIAGH